MDDFFFYIGVFGIAAFILLLMFSFFNRKSTKKGRLVFHAIEAKDMAQVKTLIAENADLSIRDNYQRTVLHYAVIEGQLDMVNLFLEKGVSVNSPDRNYHTALHFAAQEQQLKIAKLLLENGAKVKAKDKDGNTPLGKAVFYSKGKGELIQLLLSNGAEPDQPNFHGVSPRQLAETIANYDVKQFFVNV